MVPANKVAKFCKKNKNTSRDDSEAVPIYACLIIALKYTKPNKNIQSE